MRKFPAAAHFRGGHDPQHGTNFLLGTISFVSNSVTNILQLALSLDYAIIFCNHFKEEHETLPLKEAVIESLAKSIPEIVPAP